MKREVLPPHDTWANPSWTRAVLMAIAFLVVMSTLFSLVGCTSRDVTITADPGLQIHATTSGPLNATEITVRVDDRRNLSIVPVLFIPIPTPYPHTVHALAEKP